MHTVWKIYFLLLTTAQWYLRRLSIKRLKLAKPIHVFFCTVDHFEPRLGIVSFEAEFDDVATLINEYPKLASKHKDFAGNMPKRTWFFPPEKHRCGNLRRLVELCENGYGEIELHLHHGKIRPDTPENLRETIKQCIREYEIFGIFGTENGRKRYAFAHGDWALDNSRKGKYCGVNNELQILRETGCYADFTFPSMTEADPMKINSIYYATDNIRKPKSYNRGTNVKRLGKPSGDLMIIEGPLHPYFKTRSPFGLRVKGDALSEHWLTTPERIDLWIKTGIHVIGQENYIFIKTHTHGAIDSDVVCGENMHFILNYLENNYNDGVNFVLHYVTARELYNIIKAIEAGECNSNPENYRDFIVKPPSYNSSINCDEASDTLKGLINKTYPWDKS